MIMSQLTELENLIVRNVSADTVSHAAQIEKNIPVDDCAALGARYVPPSEYF